MAPQRRRARLGKDELWVLYIWDEGRTSPKAYGPYVSFDDLRTDGRPLAGDRRNNARPITPGELPSALFPTEHSAYIDPGDLRAWHEKEAARQRAAKRARRGLLARKALAVVAFLVGGLILLPLWAPAAAALLLLLPFILGYWLIEWARRQFRR